MFPGHGCGLRGRPPLRIQPASAAALDCFASLAMTGPRGSLSQTRNALPKGLIFKLAESLPPV